MLKRAAQRDMPTLIPRLFSETSAPPPATARSSTSKTSPRRRVASISRPRTAIARPFPIQVDGDYIGERTRIELRVAPGALTIVA